MSIHVDGRPRRRRMVRTGRTAVLAGAAAFTVLLAEHTTTAAFTAQTGSTNQAATATTFCTSPGVKIVVASADSTGYQGSPATIYGSDPSIAVTTGAGGNARAVLRFPLPPLSSCTVTAATLTMYVNSGQTGRIIEVYRVDPAAPVWTEADLSWNTLPATTGAAVTSNSVATGSSQQWTVTSIVQALYTGVNNGFLVRDQTDNNSPTRTQYWDSRDSATPANRPQLAVTLA
jgi:hypothetical protein